MSEVTKSSSSSTGLGGGSLGGVINESPNTLIMTVCFDGTNFLAWSQSAILYISGEARLDYLTRNVKMPNSKDSTYTKWQAENALVMSWLLHSIQPNIVSNCLFLTTAKAIWEIVTQAYKKRKEIKLGCLDFIKWYHS